VSARILVVDDNPINVKLLAAKLMRDYYVVLTAENGPDAIRKASTEKPDLILLDVMMPEMDGFETCKRLKESPQTQRIPVVMVTALSDVADRVRGLESGADDFLTKPINDTALMARVRSLLRLKMLMDEWHLREDTANQLTVPTLSQDNAAPAKILLLEDDEHSANIITETMKLLSAEPVTCLSIIDEALKEAQAKEYDMVVVSLDLQQEDGLYFCSQLRAQEITRSLPVLLIAGNEEIDRIAKGLDLGANDYILRPIERSELVARARTQIKQKRHHDWLLHNYEQSLALALVDPLTGAYNRRYLDVHLPRMFDRYRANDRPLTVIALDIDFFKKINDTYGHAAGDQVLKEVVNRARQSVRAVDLVTRMGGEEFDVIMPETDIKVATDIGERIRDRIGASPVILPDTTQAIHVTVSIGVATTRYQTEQSADSVLARADAALYKAKETGRNKVVCDSITSAPTA
jgi:two-component system cell cycle response regulator